MPGLTLPTIPRAEVEAHNTRKSCYVTIGERVFDVTDFIDSHPGGGELVLEYAGKDVKQIMEDEISHFHSEAAYEILEESLVGFMPTEPVLKAATNSSHPEQVVPLPATANGKQELKKQGVDTSEMPTRPAYASTGMSSAEDLNKDTDVETDWKTHKFLDLNRPLFAQMLFSKFSKEFYLEQVHRPRHYRGGDSAPLFGNILEPLSKTAWYMIPIIWLPPVLYGSYLGITHLPVPQGPMYWALGLFLWTLVEYLLHRFLFHLDDYLPDHPVALTLHFLLHGIHHYLPMDKYRLVMPPTLFLVLATPFYKLAHTVFWYNWYAAITVFSGGIFGYICYDCTHYWLHHHQLPSYVRELKKYHLAHHYQNFELGFGVTSKFWDTVWGTELQYAKPIKAS
ncbi:fatty acid alpha-hydroxylase [Elasticomyces elasticus]|uniref:Ceramide very long chain fatty acid hydroxylase n=1 Tax=Exophiala sideris TaxID=1016849 RepID=A0ABR0J014_9EURO|nr:fatty acid alpha-hydroxylase [Elasticomyces elasticus]KAK5022332.1 fatty acid alpha-hydroxylase [Exophiala sideris]KAK5027144.1 fatty acid alpha-hydroxylase [Exophiala sideris]KAK5051719.1 fatty acid alpha-hydroxylase [Exophiala sideris]KAK5177684.1 fatty acid alpha-hydroxylase [Eurotiomycetes sp. CCFEE 6388]